MYANDKQQVDSIGIQLLDTPLPTTEENAILVDYLLNRIIVAKNPNNHMNGHLVCNTIYSHMGVLPQTQESLCTIYGINPLNAKAYKDKCYQIRKKIKAVLDYWKTCMVKGSLFIKGYQEVKEDNTVTMFKVSW